MKYFYLSYMKTQDILQYLLPGEIMTYFDLTDIMEQDGKLIFCLDEKLQIPDDFPAGEYEAKGFTPGKNLLDFPVRGKAVVLYVRRRKWLDKNTGKVLTSTWDLNTDGTKYTKEFGAFLKELVG
jgi:transposase